MLQLRNLVVQDKPGAKAMGASKRPLIQDKPNGEFGIPQLQSSSPREKQKLSEMEDVQGVDKLNDVITVSGVNLMEEQELLFSPSTKRSRSSLPSPVASYLEKEKAFIMQKTPLERKLKQIMSQYGITCMSTDFEYCLSLGVEGLMDKLIRSMIRVSKARLGIEKTQHKILDTSDIQHQIVVMSQKDQYREKPQEHQGLDLERVAVKTMWVDRVNAAVGGKDLASKWTLTAEKENQKHDISENPTKKLMGTTSQMSASRNSNNLEPIEGTENSRGGDIFAKPHKGADLISIKDAMVMIEREFQKLKSTQTYFLLERSKVNLH